jgi:hypothetical protein
MNKFAVWKVIHPAGGIDTGYPQFSKVTPAISPVPISVPVGFHKGFIGSTEESTPCTKLALNRFDDFLVTTAGYRSTFNSHTLILAFLLSLDAQARQMTFYISS